MGATLAAEVKSLDIESVTLSSQALPRGVLRLLRTSAARLLAVVDLAHGQFDSSTSVGGRHCRYRLSSRNQSLKFKLERIDLPPLLRGGR
jgi:hypothetical protein